MNVHTVYMTTIDLQQKIHYEFEKIHGLELETRELNDVIRDYEEFCRNNEPIPTNQFIKTYLDKF